jgi:type IV pilus assembly protein PilW
VKQQTGFSMVELMVAITLALLLTGAVVSVFVGSRTAYQATAGVGDMSESGRFALNLIGESVRGAGNLACNSAMSATSQNLAAGPAIFAFGQGITGFEANGVAGTGNPVGSIAVPAVPVVGAANKWTPNLDGTFLAAATAAGPPAGLAQPVEGSDVLVLRSSAPRVPPAYTTVDVAPGAGNLVVTAMPVAIAPNGYAAVSDCTKSVIFQVNGGAAPRATAVPLTVPLVGVGFSAGAVVAPLTTTIYYIGVGSDGDSSLWRLEQVNGGPGFNPPGPEELVPDVENMQVLYGVDTAGTQTASAYVTADQVGVLNVVSIQVALLVASPPTTKQLQPAFIPACPAGPTCCPAGAAPWCPLGNALTAPVDSRVRQVFNATINLRNAVN